VRAEDGFLHRLKTGQYVKEKVATKPQYTDSRLKEALQCAESINDNFPEETPSIRLATSKGQLHTVSLGSRKEYYSVEEADEVFALKDSLLLGLWR